jgi:hypothetical protein
MKLNLDYTGDKRWDDMSDIHKKTLPIPNLFLSILYQYQNKIQNLDEIKFAIETGTYDARTSIFLSEHFDVTFTIELFSDNNPHDGKSYRETYNRLSEKYDNLTFLEGNSGELLESIFEELPDERFLILLDANNVLNSPLKEELNKIKSSSNRTDHVMLIDDCRDLGQGNFPSLQEFKELLYSINPNYNIINTEEGNHIYLVY